jgi:Inner membrane component of T3SS, cytoplasmic domain
MSFRLFVYYCAVGGAWSGFVGWFLGTLLSPEGGETYFKNTLHTTVVGMFLGFAVAFGLSFLDAAFNLSLRQFGKVFVRVLAAVLVGIFGGMFGSFIGGSLYYWKDWSVFFIISWTILGFLIGTSICFFEIFVSLITQQNFGGAIKKLIKCVVGGTVGGLLGGAIALGLKVIAGLLTRKDVESLWLPTALGFVAIGACIGLLVGLAQIILKEAWIRVEAGFRPGREMLLNKEKTSIGRGEGCDIALFGDSGVEKTHANIVLDNGRYYLEDLQTPGGSYINELKVNGRAPLKAGDLIRVGKSVLRFNERAKRKE